MRRSILLVTLLMLIAAVAAGLVACSGGSTSPAPSASPPASAGGVPIGPAGAEMARAASTTSRTAPSSPWAPSTPRPRGRLLGVIGAPRPRRSRQSSVIANGDEFAEDFTATPGALVPCVRRRPGAPPCGGPAITATIGWPSSHHGGPAASPPKQPQASSRGTSAEGTRCSRHDEDIADQLRTRQPRCSRARMLTALRERDQLRRAVLRGGDHRGVFAARPARHGPEGRTRRLLHATRRRSSPAPPLQALPPLDAGAAAPIDRAPERPRGGRPRARVTDADLRAEGLDPAPCAAGSRRRTG